VFSSKNALLMNRPNLTERGLQSERCSQSGDRRRPACYRPRLAVDFVKPFFFTFGDERVSDKVCETLLPQFVFIRVIRVNLSTLHLHLSAFICGLRFPQK
jgi:hypothetical protein